MAAICCETGFHYNSMSSLCVADSGSGATKDPFECTCCPSGLTYIDQNGYFVNLYTGSIMKVLTWTDGPVQNVYGKCALTQAAPEAYGATIDPINCPCCPEGYFYSSQLKLCVKSIGATKDTMDPIPCIVCICPTDGPPPTLQCDTCNEQSGQSIFFQYNPFIKQCTNCTPQDFVLTNDPKLNCFMPYFLIQPDNNNNFNLDA